MARFWVALSQLKGEGWEAVFDSENRIFLIHPIRYLCCDPVGALAFETQLGITKRPITMGIVAACQELNLPLRFGARIKNAAYYQYSHPRTRQKILRAFCLKEPS
ncbi:MAG: hypothetical protein HYT46_03625 [Candidatus Vogelbacteria bacterium]|nr:hypothetical protein [Candidatus Vogelbacteria bacterium]